MKTIILIAGLLLSAQADAVSCTTQTITINGKTMTCVTCCWQGNCDTTCS
jgi:hypothetical protein